MSDTRSRCVLRALGPALFLALVLGAATQGAWAANEFSSFRIDENVAQFNMYAGNFLIAEPVHVSVDYEYDGGHGSPVWIGVEVRKNGVKDTRFGYVPHKVTAGKPEGRAECRLSVVPASFPAVNTLISGDAIRFKLYDNDGAVFFTKDIDVKTKWAKPFPDITRADIAALVSTPSAAGDASKRTLKMQLGKPPLSTIRRPALEVMRRPGFRLEAAGMQPTSGKLSTTRFKVGMTMQRVMLVGKTNQGRYFAALCQHRTNSSLRLNRWKVFAGNGSVHRSGTNTVVERTHHANLDGASNNSVENDLWWHFETETRRYIEPENGAKMSVAYVQYANYNLASPPSKKIFLELDKIAGADFPPYVVDRNGKLNSLESIYASGGIDLKLLSHEHYIPDLKDGGNYSKADMDSFFDAHFDATCPSGYWHMHGAMLTRTSGGYLGWMYRSGDRRGFTVFTASFSATDKEAKLLRTTAHELGHGVNLFHNDSDVDGGGYPVSGQGTTIMAQTWSLASDWGYEWNTDSLDHLNNHPVNRIRPNSGYGFDECISSHKALY